VVAATRLCIASGRTGTLVRMTAILAGAVPHLFCHTNLFCNDACLRLAFLPLAPDLLL